MVRAAIGISLIVLSGLLACTAITLAILAQDAGTVSLTAKILGFWFLPPFAAGVALTAWGLAPLD